MFTGIISSLGRMVRRDDFSVEIVGPLKQARVGDSIAVNGICLTVVRSQGTSKARRVRFDVSQETIDRTSLAAWTVGRQVNLEPALRAGDPFGGHMVQGHVDGVGRLEKIGPMAGGRRFTFSFPALMNDFFVHKGSVAVDGISLTLIHPRGGRFDVAVIPHTEKMTTLGAARVGDAVNLEADMIAKQVAGWLRERKTR